MQPARGDPSDEVRETDKQSGVRKPEPETLSSGRAALQHRHADERTATRGRYKIFLGMAAGVGKTYRMLQEGQAEAEAGRDVVIGYLEPHGRAETVALGGGPGGDSAPPRELPRHGAGGDGPAGDPAPRARSCA